MNKNKSFTVKITALLLFVQTLFSAAGIIVYSSVSKGKALMAYANAETVGELEKLQFDVFALAAAFIICLVLFAVIFSMLLSKINEKERASSNNSIGISSENDLTVRP